MASRARSKRRLKSSTSRLTAERYVITGADPSAAWGVPLAAARDVLDHEDALANLPPDRLAPAVGLEPTTKRLTAARSTTELRRSEVPRRKCRGRAPSRRRATGYQRPPDGRP